MGREIRKVPKGWEHPRCEKRFFKALHDDDYQTVARKWVSDCILWSQRNHEDQKRHDNESEFFWEWEGGPPDEDSYRPKFTEPADHFQIYETVSEGTPVSPVFESIEDMINWMVQPIDRSLEYNIGKDWQCMQGMTREQAERFCKSGSSPSLIVRPGISITAGHRESGEG